MLAEDGGEVTGALGAAPFPIPQNGLEAIWNHLLHYRAESLRHTTTQAIPTPGGTYTMVVMEEEVIFPFNQPGVTSETAPLQCLFLQTVEAPARLAGYILLVHDPLALGKVPRRAWTYNPGQRRVRRAPQIGYDNPGTAADGQRTNDQTNMFCGAPDRYEWTLLGRKELYIGYNAYRVQSDALTYDEIIYPGHLNPEHLRYELHRVWVVDARIKEGLSHIYPRRTMHIDEDSWFIALADEYDARGEIWRVSEAHMLNFYDIPTMWSTVLTHCDLQNGRYVARGLNNETDAPRLNIELSPRGFTPEALRRLGRH
jgi:hypothetical protein